MTVSVKPTRNMATTVLSRMFEEPMGTLDASDVVKTLRENKYPLLALESEKVVSDERYSV